MTRYFEKQRDVAGWRLSLYTDNLPAQIALDLGTVIVPALAFDQTTEETIHGEWAVPADADTDGTVIFRAYLMSIAEATNKTVTLKYGCRVTSSGGELGSPDFDRTYGHAVDGSATKLTMFQWTDTMDDLGWHPGDWIIDRIARIESLSANLPGDSYLLFFTILVPLT